MMTFVFHNSSINTEVDLQPQPRGTESWTVGALEVSCCDHCRGCSAVSLSGSSEFLASSLFEFGSSFVNQATPFCSIHGISLQVSRFDVAPLEIGFDRVFIPQFWSTLVSFAVHQASRYPTLLHSNHVSNPSKLGLDVGGLSAGGLSLIEDLKIGDVILPPDYQDGAEDPHMYIIQVEGEIYWETKSTLKRFGFNEPSSGLWGMILVMLN